MVAAELVLGVCFRLELMSGPPNVLDPPLPIPSTTAGWNGVYLFNFIPLFVYPDGVPPYYSINSSAVGFFLYPPVPGGFNGGFF